MSYTIKLTAGECKGKYLDSCGEVCDRKNAYHCGGSDEAEDIIAMSIAVDIEDKPKIITVK